MTFQYKEENKYNKMNKKHDKRMEFLTASIKEKQKQKREELRQFLLMKDRAIIK